MINRIHCRGCPLEDIGHPMDPQGSDTARFMVVVDTPSRFSAAKGRVLPESSTRLFAKHMDLVGFSRQEFIFVPQIRCPHEADQLETKQKREIKKHCREHLLEDIQHYNPELIVPLGAEPSSQVFGRAVKITKIRGVVSHSEEHGTNVMPLLSPGQVTMYPQHEGVFSADCRSMARAVDSEYDMDAAGEVLLGKYEFIDDLQFLIDSKPPLLFFDTETTSLEYFKEGPDNVRGYATATSPKDFNPSAAILTMQFCTKPGKAYMLVWDHPERPIPQRRKKRILQQLTQLLCAPHTRVLGQNAKYDNTYVFEQTGIRYKIGGDTLMIAALLDENMLSKGQDVLVKHYVPEMGGYADSFNATVDKSRMWEVPLAKLIDYGCGDVDSGMLLYKATIKELLKDERLFEHYRHVSLPGLNVFSSVETRGILIDEAALDAFETTMAESVATQYTSLIAQVPRGIKRKHIDKGLKFSRADFVRDILFRDREGFRLRPKVFTDSTKNLSVDKRVPSTSTKDHLPYFYDECPFAMELAQYVKDERLLGTNIRSFKKKYVHNGLVRPTYSLWTAVTGRSACVKDDTPIVTIRGKVRADEVMLGDLVWTHIGRWRRITELFQKPETLMYSLYLSNGEVLTVTGQHEVLLISGEWSKVEALFDTGERDAFPMQSRFTESSAGSVGSRYVQDAVSNNTASGGPSRSKSSDGEDHDTAVYTGGGVSKVKEYEVSEKQTCGEEPTIRARVGVRLRGWQGIPDAANRREEVLCASDSVCGVSGATRIAATGGFSSTPHRREPKAQQDRQSIRSDGGWSSENPREVSDAGGGLAIEKIVCAGVYRVYDFQVDEDHSYLACGIFNHNSENPNGQNFPKRGPNAKAYRRIFVAPPGYYVLEADLSQAELRIAADMAHDRAMLDIYGVNGDIHSATAAIVVGVPLETFMQWKSDKRKLIEVANSIPGSGNYLRKLPPGRQREATVKDYYSMKRQEAKAINFGFVYGMGWRKFIGYAKTQYGVEFTEQEAQDIRTTFFDTYYGLPLWHEAMRQFAHREAYVRSYSGRIRHLPMIYSDDEGVAAEAGRQAINCLSDDTEILTVHGWKTVDEIRVGDIVYSANTSTGALEEDRVNCVNVGNYSGRMLSLEGSGISALSTPNHRWVVDTAGQGANKGKVFTSFKASEDLSMHGGHKLWLSTSGGTAEATVWEDNEVRLLGWILTDGHYKGKSGGRVGVTQSKSKNVSEICRIFAGVGKHHHTVRSTGQHVWEVTSAVGQYIRDTMPDKTLTAEVLRTMSSAQHRILFDTMLKGDGCWDEASGRYRKFCAGSQDRADAFLQLCALIGQPARAYYRDTSGYALKKYASMGNIPKTEGHWLVELKQRNRTQPQYGASWVEWSGRVWCPTTTNGTWVAKRNGRVFITGNSPVQGFGSDLGIMACGRIYEEIDSRFLAPVAFVHDAIFAYVPKRYLEWGAKTLKHYMESNDIEGNFGIRMECPILADVSFGMNFGDTNELGGLSLDSRYDFSEFWNEEEQKGIQVPPQSIPPNRGRLAVPPYTQILEAA